jgi:hypothetical protein
MPLWCNSRFFSAVKGVLIAPLPYPDPDRLVRIFEESAKMPHFPMAPAHFRDYREVVDDPLLFRAFRNVKPPEEMGRRPS